MQTLTLDITFEWYEIGFSYLTCEFLMMVPVQDHLSRSRSNIKITVFEKKKKNGRCGGVRVSQTHLVVCHLIVYQTKKEKSL